MKQSVVLAVVAFACASVWADTWSWAGKSGVVTIPAGTTATIADDDIATVEALTGIAIESGASLTFANTQPIVVNANLSGAGAISGNAAGAITLGGDNVNHTGAMAFNGTAALTVVSRHGLGSDTRRVDYYGARLLFKGNGLTNDVPLLLGLEIKAGTTMLTENASDPLVLNGYVTVKSGQWTTFDMGNWTLSEIRRNSNNYWFSTASSTHAKVGKFTLSGSSYAPFNLDSGSTFTLTGTGSTWTCPIIYGGGAFVCGAANVLPSATEVGLGYSSGKSGTLDLNGFDQTVTTVRHTTYSSWPWNPTDGEADFVTVRSATPATITMTGNSSPTSNIKYTGKVSLVKQGTGTYTLANTFSDTVGALDVQAGAVRFIWGAGWGGDVTVSAGAKVIFENGSKTGAMLGDRTKVTLADTAKLVLSNGVTLVCAKLTVGGDVKTSGTFGAADLPDWIEGEGTITVIAVPDNVFTWTGAGDGWNDEASWAEEGKPVAGDGVLIPSGKIADVTDDDVDLVAGLAAIKVEAGGRVNLLNGGKDLALKANLSGAGGVYSYMVKSVTLTGDNKLLLGPLEFTNTALVVASRYALGSPTRRCVHYKGDLVFRGEGLTNDVPFAIAQGYAKLTDNLTDPLVMNGYLDYVNEANGVPDMTFGNYTFNGGIKKTKGTWCFSTAANCTTTYNNLPFENGAGTAYFPYSIGSNGRVIVNVAGNTWGEKLAIGGAGTFVCGATNLFPSAYFLSLGRVENTVTTLDLNGFDQTVKYLIDAQYPSWWKGTLSESTKGYGKVTSAESATLTVTGGDGKKGAMKFSGKANLRKTGTGTWTLVNQISDTQGSLLVDAGAVAFDWSAGWGGKVELSGTGRAIFAAGTSLGGEATSDVTLSDEAKLELASGVALRCRSLTVGGETKGIGTYSKANLPDWIEGEGTISVVPTYEEGKRYVWTGAIDGDVEKAGNWENEDKPAFNGSGTLDFTAGSGVITLPNHEIAAYGLEIGAGASVTISGGDGTGLRLGVGGFKIVTPAGGLPTEPVACTVDVPVFLDRFPAPEWVIPEGVTLWLKKPISGGVATDTLLASGGGAPGGTIVLEGDNTTLAAALELDDLNVRVLHPNGLGSSTRRTTLKWPNKSFSATRNLKFVGDGLTNNVPIYVFNSDCSTLEKSFVENFDDPLVFNGELRFDTSITTFYVPASWTLRGGITERSGSYVFTGAGTGKSNLYVEDTPICVYHDYLLLSAVHVHLNVAGNNWKYLGNAALVTCGVENAYDGGTASEGSVYFGTYYDWGYGTVDLGGLDQNVRMLERYGSSWKEDIKQTTTQFGTVTSETPAMFRILRSKGTEYRYPLRVCGLAGLEQAGGATNRLVIQKSPTAGQLKVTAGKLLLEWGAGFTNVTSVVVSGGCLEIAEDSAATAFGPRTGKSSADLSISGDGVLQLDGGRVTVKSLTVDGVAKEDGFYGSLTCTDPRVPAANRLACIEGEGVVKTGKFGLSVIVR